jgi:hypothetical protein
MPRLIDVRHALAFLLSALAISACSGSPAGIPTTGSPTTVAPSPPTQTTSKTKASAGITFTILLKPHGAVTTPSSVARASVSRVKPQFISMSGNGAFDVFVDGTQVLDASFAPPTDSNGNPIPGPGPSSSVALANGGSLAYTSTVTSTAITVNATVTMLAGSHTLGVVQTNGPCAPDPYGRELCIANTNGYVLSEGQASFTLVGGQTITVPLYMRGVMESAFLCDAACDGGAGTPDASGLYHITAYASDEAGDAIYQQTDSSDNLVPFDNGSYSIVETDGQGIVTLGGLAASYNVPGNAGGQYGQAFTVACNKAGMATIAMELVATDPSQGDVTGFTYTSANYPAAGSVLSTIGADEYEGNTLGVNCSTSGSANVVIQ